LGGTLQQEKIGKNGKKKKQTRGIRKTKTQTTPPLGRKRDKEGDQPRQGAFRDGRPESLIAANGTDARKKWAGAIQTN